MSPNEPMSNDLDLRSRIVAVEQKHVSFEPRLINLENRLNQRDIADARKDEQFKNMDKRFDSLDSSISSINDTLKWVNRTIIGAFIVALLTFSLRGGLTTITDTLSIDDPTPTASSTHSPSK